MDKQMINPPDTWNDEKAIRESFRLWFGWYGWKDKRAARAAFRRGYMSGAFTATIAMWNWLQGTVMGKFAPIKTAEPEKDLSMISEREQTALDMIIETGDWISGSVEEAATGEPDMILLHACKIGVKHLESIADYLKTGNIPEWYTGA